MSTASRTLAAEDMISWLWSYQLAMRMPSGRWARKPGQLLL